MLRFFFLLLAALSAAAQTTTGTIVGTVKDSSGAGISGARIHVTNEGTGISAAATSNASGDFVVPNLTASTYSLLVESQGMRPAALTGIQLLVEETYRADVRMEPGALQQSITVAAQSGEVNADTSSVYAVDSIPARYFGVFLQSGLLLAPTQAAGQEIPKEWGELWHPARPRRERHPSLFYDATDRARMRSRIAIEPSEKLPSVLYCVKRCLRII